MATSSRIDRLVLGGDRGRQMPAAFCPSAALHPSAARPVAAPRAKPVSPWRSPPRQWILFEAARVAGSAIDAFPLAARAGPSDGTVLQATESSHGAGLSGRRVGQRAGRVGPVVPRGLHPLVLGVVGISWRGAGGGRPGGWKPGFLTTALSACWAALFLVRPYYSFRVASTGDMLRIFGSVLGRHRHQPALRSLASGLAANRRPAATAGAGAAATADRHREHVGFRSSIAAATSNTSGSASPTPTGSGCRPNRSSAVRSSRSSAARPLSSCVPSSSRCLPAKAVHYEEVVDYSSGSGRRWINAVYTPTLDAAGVPNGWVGVLLDITERRQDGRGAAAQRRAFRALHAVSSRLWPGSRILRGRYVFANDAAVDDLQPSARRVLWQERHGHLSRGRSGGNSPRTIARRWPVRRACSHRNARTCGRGRASLARQQVPHSWARRAARRLSAASPSTSPTGCRPNKCAPNRKNGFASLPRPSTRSSGWSTSTRRRSSISVPAYERVWGRTCQSLYERPLSFLDAVHPDDRERVQAAAVGAARAAANRPTKSIGIVTPDGSVRWIREPGLSGQGRLRDASSAWRGLPRTLPRKSVPKRRSKEADRRKDEFLATLAHELRNPLAPIRNAVELMQQADGDPPVMEEARNVS